MRTLLTALCCLTFLTACGDLHDDRIVGDWERDTGDGVERVTFHDDDSLRILTAEGDTVGGRYEFVGGQVVRLEAVEPPDTLVYLWTLSFHGDSMIARTPGGERLGMKRAE